MNFVNLYPQPAWMFPGSMHVEYLYSFFPVGQGLFSRGRIRHSHSKSAFQWVYDCGTSSEKTLIDSGIERLKNHGNQIDLLVLSHFDHDHINGVCRLLQKFKVGTLMLPYMTLAQRLVIAFENSQDDDDSLIDFYLNPVRYLLEQDGLGVGRIILVPPSGNTNTPYPGEILAPDDPDDPDNLEIRIAPEPVKEPDKASDPADVEILLNTALYKNSHLLFLTPGSKLVIPSLMWEFIPYNDDPLQSISEEFENQVDEKRDKLLNCTSKIEHAETLKNLKKYYLNYFGASKQNLISLFLYSGPIYSSYFQFLFFSDTGIPNATNCSSKSNPGIRVSILYSGDGFLDSEARVERLINYLNERRISRIRVFQVMHHGAKSNWHAGIGNKISPTFSIFSSDPYGRWKHPNQEVRDDFKDHGIRQVDKSDDFNDQGRVFPQLQSPEFQSFVQCWNNGHELVRKMH